MDTVVLIPAYNEEKTIKEIIKDLKKRVKSKIIVVNDASTDKTGELAEKERVLVLTHKTNKGKGGALKTGFRYILKNLPKIEYVILIDADSQYPPSEVPKILKPLKNKEADVVSGYRNWKKIPFRHRLGNFVWKTSFNFFFGTSFKDTNCGLMGLNRKTVKVIKNIGGGYIIENMMYSQIIEKGLIVKQVPVKVVYHEVRDVPSGVRILLGVLIFIVREGIKHRLKNLKS